MANEVDFSAQTGGQLLKLRIVDLRIDIKVPRMSEKCLRDLTFLVILQLKLNFAFVPQQMSRCEHRWMEKQAEGDEA